VKSIATALFVVSLTAVMASAQTPCYWVGQTTPPCVVVNCGSNIAAKSQDVAEWVSAGTALEPATVVVLDPSHDDQVIASTTSYDTTVAGVVSPTPGLILGVGAKGKGMIATTRRVEIKVDAKRAPIKIGDLLVTSDIQGDGHEVAAVRGGWREDSSPRHGQREGAASNY
jgi:hypothetical protein